MSVKREGKLNGVQARVENGAKEGLILAADLIAQRARGKAPVDTGRLKRSVTRGNPFKTSGGMSISVGTNVSYAEFQERGTKYMDAHPYLRPAIQESERDAITIIAKRIVAKMVKR